MSRFSHLRDQNEQEHEIISSPETSSSETTQERYVDSSEDAEAIERLRKSAFGLTGTKNSHLLSSHQNQQVSEEEDEENVDETHEDAAVVSDEDANEENDEKQDEDAQLVNDEAVDEESSFDSDFQPQRKRKTSKLQVDEVFDDTVNPDDMNKDVTRILKKSWLEGKDFDVGVPEAEFIGQTTEKQTFNAKHAYALMHSTATFPMRTTAIDADTITQNTIFVFDTSDISSSSMILDDGKAWTQHNLQKAPNSNSLVHLKGDYLKDRDEDGKPNKVKTKRNTYYEMNGAFGFPKQLKPPRVVVHYKVNDVEPKNARRPNHGNLNKKKTVTKLFNPPTTYRQRQQQQLFVPPQLQHVNAGMLPVQTPPTHQNQVHSSSSTSSNTASTRQPSQNKSSSTTTSLTRQIPTTKNQGNSSSSSSSKIPSSRLSSQNKSSTNTPTSTRKPPPLQNVVQTSSRRSSSSNIPAPTAPRPIAA